MPLAIRAGFDVVRFGCANVPSVRGFPCGKSVRWLGWSRLTDFAQSGECQLRGKTSSPKISNWRAAPLRRLPATVQSIGQQRAPECHSVLKSIEGVAARRIVARREI